MNLLRSCTLASTLLLFGPSIPSTALAQRSVASPARTLNGELVVTNAGTRQFRLVGHDGSFTAPAGTLLQDLDGKPVQVELGDDGRVLDIVETPIHVKRVTHSEEVVSGQLMVRDPVLRTFTLAGDARVYTAPASTDVRTYAGRMVEIRLGEAGQVITVRSIASTGTTAASEPPRTCAIGDATVADGSTICRAGVTFRCADGSWVSVGTPCR